MLVLTRKLNERIQIGDKITVSILRIKGNSVRVGIEAPRQVRVVRGELPPKEAAEEVVDLSELAEGAFRSRLADQTALSDGQGEKGASDTGEGEGGEDEARVADGVPRLSQKARLALAAWDLATEMLGP